ncbi:phosphatidylinositol-specific phospholipase C domain-containing protein [Streptomyces sp. NPDC056835]|uniref:phosphatidylinositol-specific phospholipase C domain-containing protein n=1 Tax=Streptomyces sp. NPDC056835 TaxID=3345956 RepID=UPI0036BEBB83
MSRVPDGVRLTDMSIPGTHETCAMYKAGSLGWARCQYQPLSWQLYAGIRYIDIRLGRHETALGVYHGPFYMSKSLYSVLNDCKQFLRAHPTETLLMRVRREDKTSDSGFIALFEREVSNIGWGWVWYDKSATRFPTLEEARGRIVIMSGEPYLGGGVKWNDPSLFVTQDLYADPSVAEKQRRVAENLESSIATGVGEGRKKLYVNHTSANGKTGSNIAWTPWDFARRLNPYVLDLLNDKYAENIRTGVIAMDYVCTPDPGGKDDASDIDLIAAVIRMNEFKNPRLADSKSYVIWNRSTGKAIGAKGGAGVKQESYDGYPNQVWQPVRGRAGLVNEKSGSGFYLGNVAEKAVMADDYAGWDFQEVPGKTGFLVKRFGNIGYLHIPHGSKSWGVQAEVDKNTSYDWYRWQFDERVSLDQKVIMYDTREEAENVDVDFKVLEQAEGGYYKARYTLRNTGTRPIETWAVDLLMPTGVTIDTVWGAATKTKTRDIDPPLDPPPANGQSNHGTIVVTLTGNTALPTSTDVQIEYSGNTPDDRDPTPHDFTPTTDTPA